jgi:hypothetical protein
MFNHMASCKGWHNLDADAGGENQPNTKLFAEAFLLLQAKGAKLTE